ncbi:alpha/beta fold hydrolase [Candidatus Margulisiibacteriota bacterium]
MLYVFLHGWSFTCDELKGKREKGKGERSAAPPRILRSGAQNDVTVNQLRSTIYPDLYALQPPLTFSHMAEQLYGQLKALQDDLILIGWSMGGSIALELLLRYEDLPVKGLVLTGATPKFVNDKDYDCGLSPAVCRNLRRRLIRDPQGTLEYFRSQLGEVESYKVIKLKGHPAPPRILRSGAQNDVGDKPPTTNHQPLTTRTQNPKPIPLSALLETLDELYSADYRDMLKSIRVPTVIIHGKEDRICPVGAAEYFHERIPGSKLEVFEATGHMPFYRHFQKFMDIVQKL